MRNSKVETSLTANFGKRKAIKFQPSNNNFIELYNTVGTTIDTASNPLDLTYYFSVPEISSPSEYQQLFYFDDSGTRHIHVRLFARSISLSVENDDGSTVYFSNVSSDVLPATVNIFNKFQIRVSGRSIFLWLNNVLIQENINILVSGDSFIYDILRLGYSVFAASPQYYFNEGFILADLKGTYTFRDFYKNSTDLSAFGDLVYKFKDLVSGSDIFVFGHGGASLTAKNDSKEYDTVTLHDTSNPAISNTLLQASAINSERVDKEGNVVAVDSQITLRRKSTTEFLFTDVLSLQNYSDEKSDGTYQLTFNSPINFVELDVMELSDGASVKFYKGDATEDFDWDSVTATGITGLKTFFFIDPVNILSFKIDGSMKYSIKENSHRFFRLNYDNNIYLMYSQFPSDLTEVTRNDFVIDLFGLEGLLFKRLVGIDVRDLGIPLYDLELVSLSLPASHAHVFDGASSQRYNPLVHTPTKFAKLNEILTYLLNYSGFEFFSFADFPNVWYRQALYAARYMNGDYRRTGDLDFGPLYPDFSKCFNDTVLPNIATADASDFLKFLMFTLGGVYYFNQSNIIFTIRSESNELLDKKLLKNTKKYQSFDPKTLYEIEQDTDITRLTYADFYSYYDNDFQTDNFSITEILPGAGSQTYYYDGYPIMIDGYRGGYEESVSGAYPAKWSAIDYIEDDAKSNGLTHLFLKTDGTTNNGYSRVDVYSDYFEKSIRISKTSFELIAQVQGVDFFINKKLTEDGKEWSVYKQSVVPSGDVNSGKRTTIYALPIDE